MSALAMILTAAMVIPGDGPEKVSGEVERSPQPLDLRGEWAWIQGFGADPMCPALVTGSDMIRFFDIIDEKGGKVRFQYPFCCTYLGIYKRTKTEVVISFREASKGRATSFRTGDGQELLILRRTNIRK